MARLPPALTFRLLALSVILGTASGIIGAALTTASLSNYAASLGDFASPLRSNGSRPPAPATALADARDQAFAASAQLYAAKTDAPDAFRADRQGVILTSDGWIAALDSGHPFLTALVGRRSYPVLRSVTDPVSGVLFLKIDGRNLPTVGFGDALAAAAGDEIEAVDARETFRVARVLSTVRPVQYATDRPARRIQSSLLAGSVGAPVFSAAGDLLGFAAADGTVDAVNGVLPGFRSVLKDGSTRRAALGLVLADLSRTVVPASSASAATDSGVRVLSVAKGSDAEKAGFRAGDVILSWDGRTLDSAHPLDELLLADNPGQTVIASVQRADARADLSVVLR